MTDLAKLSDALSRHDASGIHDALFPPPVRQRPPLAHILQKLEDVAAELRTFVATDEED